MPFSPRPRAGFSMLEVLLAIALLALLGGALISVGSNLITVQPVTVDDVFWKAVTETRKAALKAEHEMRLKYDAEKKSFRVIDGITPTRLAADGFSMRSSTKATCGSLAPAKGASFSSVVGMSGTEP